MKKLNFPKPADRAERDRLAFRGGSYSLLITAMVLAILVVVNVFVSALPATLTKYDISAAKLYSITSNTKTVVNGLQQDVTIYWVVQSGEEDEIIENLLGKYESLSSHIEVVKKNPDVYPTFTEQYTSEDVPNNSLIVVSGERYRYISYSDIYESEFDYYSYTYVTSGFDGEGAITSAIDYVVSEELPQLYTLEGHGEEELPSTFAGQIERENMTVSSLSLTASGEVPEDAACVLIYAPSSDLSEDEAELLAEYVSGGGRLLVMAGPVDGDTLENLYSLLGRYGVTAAEGIVVEEDPDHYSSFQGPAAPLPDMTSGSIMDPLIEANYQPIMTISQGLVVSGDPGSATVTELLTTSGTSFSKTAGYGMTTYDWEGGDIDGPFALAVSVEDSSGGGIVWFSSSYFLMDDYNAASSGANGDMVMNALSSLVGESEAMAIRSKSLNYNYLTISESTASLLKTVMIGIFPLAYLGIGIYVILRRRRQQNETV